MHNTTEVAEGLDRNAALRSSLLSTHVIARVAGGRFLSPIAPPEHAAMAVMTSACVNTYPVLATPEDDVLLGAAIILPDHPQLAPESRGDLFDGTEIEEALLLHLLVLSDDERESIADQDPAVREMLRRAIATTPGGVREAPRADHDERPGPGRDGDRVRPGDPRRGERRRRRGHASAAATTSACAPTKAATRRTTC